jgi:hypothetical protein
VPPPTGTDLAMLLRTEFAPAGMLGLILVADGSYPQLMLVVVKVLYLRIVIETIDIGPGLR